VSIIAVLLAVGIVTGNVNFWRILSAFSAFVAMVGALYLIVYVATRAYHKAKSRAKK
jgi:hypothetical protein